MRFILPLSLLALLAVDRLFVPSDPPVRQPRPMIVVDATPAQEQRLNQAVTRFDSIGLQLPELEVRFVSTEESCRGHDGLFDPTVSPWRITFCSDLDYVYEHELAHAWERANLTDDKRQAFLDERSLAVWSDRNVPWRERGVEAAAFIIQQGLLERPLPAALSSERRSRLVAFELLTGRASPRLRRWLRANEVPCADRPTAISRHLPDAAGRTCPLL